MSILNRKETINKIEISDDYHIDHFYIVSVRMQELKIALWHMLKQYYLNHYCLKHDYIETALFEPIL